MRVGKGEGWRMWTEMMLGQKMKDAGPTLAMDLGNIMVPRVSHTSF